MNNGKRKPFSSQFLNHYEPKRYSQVPRTGYITIAHLNYIAFIDTAYSKDSRQSVILAFHYGGSKSLNITFGPRKWR